MIRYAEPQYVEAIARIETWAPVWQERLGLSHIEIEHKYLDTFEDVEPKTSADCAARWQYDVATIRWYLPSIVRLKRALLEQTLVHELCHVLLAPEQSIVDTLNELGTAEAVAAAGVAGQLLELSTERTARALWRGFGPAIQRGIS